MLKGDQVGLLDLTDLEAAWSAVHGQATGWTEAEALRDLAGLLSVWRWRSGAPSPNYSSSGGLTTQRSASSLARPPAAIRASRPMRYIS